MCASPISLHLAAITKLLAKLIQAKVSMNNNSYLLPLRGLRIFKKRIWSEQFFLPNERFYTEKLDKEIFLVSELSSYESMQP